MKHFIKRILVVFTAVLVVQLLLIGFVIYVDENIAGGVNGIVSGLHQINQWTASFDVISDCVALVFVALLLFRYESVITWLFRKGHISEGMAKQLRARRWRLVTPLVAFLLLVVFLA